jgi:Bifunctional DNA primase/polymerase, N-terminal
MISDASNQVIESGGRLADLLVAQALEYSRLGLAVIPTRPNTKRPAEKWKMYQTITPTPDQVIASFNRHPDTTGIAIIAGMGSGNLVILDPDNRNAFNMIRDRLTLPTWIVSRAFQKGDPHYGGGHIYLRATQPIRTCKRGAIDIKGQGGYVLAPPSKHPTGAIYTTIAGSPESIATVDIASLNWLEVEVAEVDTAIGSIDQQRPKYFPRRAWRLLHGIGMDSYGSRSEAEQAIVTALINAGYTFQAILDTFKRWSYSDSRFKYEQERGEHYAVDWLMRSYRNAVSFVTENQSSVTLTVVELRKLAAVRSWRGNAGATDRAVYLAHLSIARRAQSMIYGASVRELAELAGIRAETVSNSNKRLISHHRLIVRAERDIRQAAYAYQLLPVSESVQSSHFSNVRDCTEIDWSHDLWRRGMGLGKVAAEVWAVLQADDLSQEEIVTATKRSKPAVSKTIGRMRDAGMIAPILNKWHASKIDLDEVAKQVGCWGIGAKQKAHHIQERITSKREIEAKHANSFSIGKGIKKRNLPIDFD